MATMQDVAALAHLSVRTVSYAHSQTRPVSPAGELLAREPGPTAVITLNEIATFGAIVEPAVLGLHAPTSVPSS